MQKLAVLLIGLIRNYIILYFFWKALGFMFQPISNIIAMINSFVKKKAFSSKNEFIVEARRDIYVLISLMVYFFAYFFLLTILAYPEVFAFFLIMSFIVGLGLFVTPLPKRIRTKNYPVTILSNYILPILYWGVVLLSIYVVLPHYF